MVLKRYKSVIGSAFNTPLEFIKIKNSQKKMRIKIGVIMVATTGLEPAATTMSR